MMELIKNELNRTQTENGDTAYISTYDANLDFFGLAAASRYNQEQVSKLFLSAYSEDPSLALMNLLYLRDIRSGLGERDSFRTCFDILCHTAPNVAKKMLQDIIHYGRTDDILMGLNTPIEEDVVKFIKNTLEQDLNQLEEGKPTSYMAKWLPSENATKKETIEQAKYLIEKLGYTPKQYRKLLSKLRSNKIIENNLRLKDYTFNYETVPGKALQKYEKAFIRNDIERYEHYLDGVKERKVKINSEALYPYDIIRKFDYRMSEASKKQMQVLWDSIPKTLSKSKTIVVRDGSASMTMFNCLPMLISTSLAILFSEQLEGEFKDAFITFSSDPQLIQLKGDNLYQKLLQIYLYDDISNTDIEKVYKLLLNVADRPDFKKEDMIERIVIISDMEFDCGVKNIPTYETFKEEFEKRGLSLPEIIYWNVCARRPHFATNAGDKNIRFVSGASHHTIDMILNNEHIESVYEMMMRALKLYEHVKEYVQESCIH